MNERQEISIHDNILVSYEVLCERQEIRLRTEFRDRGEPFEYTDVIFMGVACYDFEHDSVSGTIIFEIDEISASDIYLDHGEQLRAGVRYDWPGKWAESAESATAYFDQQGICGFRISSSCGMCGWVLAQQMTKVPGLNHSNRHHGNVADPGHGAR